MLSLTYEITTALSHTDELISPPYDIAIVTISYGRVTMSSVWNSMMSKKNMGWPFYAAVRTIDASYPVPHRCGGPTWIWDTRWCLTVYHSNFLIYNHIKRSVCDVITHPCHTFNVGLPNRRWMQGMDELLFPIVLHGCNFYADASKRGSWNHSNV